MFQTVSVCSVPTARKVADIGGIVCVPWAAYLVTAGFSMATACGRLKGAWKAFYFLTHSSARCYAINSFVKPHQIAILRRRM